MVDWAAIGGVGRGITEGLDDKRKMDEAAQMKKLREYQLAQLQENQDTQKAIKGLKKVGTPTYDKSLQDNGAGYAQAKALDAQTGDMGPEAAQLTANALAGPGPAKAPEVKGIPYSAGQRSQDMADALASTNPELAAKFEDRAFTLGQRDIDERLSQWRRQSAGMGVKEAARALANVVSADGRTNVAAFMSPTQDNPEGLPKVTVFNSKTGEHETHVVKNMQELQYFADQHGSAMTRQEAEKQMGERAKLGIQAQTANAAVSNAETQRSEFNAKKDAGVFIEQAKHYAAQTKSLEVLAPAQAAQAQAHANYYNTLGTISKEKAKEWESKLGDTEKMFIGILKDTTLKATHDSVLDPSPANVQAAMSAKYQLANQMEQFGAKGFDKYAMSGVTRPEVAAAQVVASKAKPDAIAAAVQKASSTLGMEYATKFKSEVDGLMAKQAADKTKVGTSNVVGSAPSLIPDSLRGIVQGDVNPGSPYAKAREKQKPGHTVGLVDIAKEAFSK